VRKLDEWQQGCLMGLVMGNFSVIAFVSLVIVSTGR